MLNSPFSYAPLPGLYNILRDPQRNHGSARLISGQASVCLYFPFEKDGRHLNGHTRAAEQTSLRSAPVFPVLPLSDSILTSCFEERGPFPLAPAKLFHGLEAHLIEKTWETDIAYPTHRLLALP